MRSPLNVSGCIPVSTRMRPSVLLLAALLAGAMSIEVSAQEIRIDPWKAADQTKASGAADANGIAPAAASDASSSAAGTLAALFDTPCANGFAGPFPCQNVDLLAFLPIDSIGGVRNPEGELLTSLNDIWGWTDPETGREYALVGRSDGTSFVDVTEPTNPLLVGSLPPTPGAYNSIWRDVKVYADHAFIVADNAGAHGVQVFDLTQLRGVTSPPTTFAPTATYNGIGSAHNIVINEETGFAYAVGSSGGTNGCGSGLHMIDIREPKAPAFVGCHNVAGTGRARNGYTHDAQCVIYKGPDERYQGHEICLMANESHVVISDVTDKENPKEISRAEYPDVAYAHQGWLTDDHQYFLQDDELDHRSGTPNTRTRIWDVTNLEDPILADVYIAESSSIDHNLYVRGDRVFQSNYTSGLRILDITEPPKPVEVGYFDGFPGHDGGGFLGSWSNYPYFDSGNVIFTGINEGLFIVRPTNEAVFTDLTPPAPTDFDLLAAFPNPFTNETKLEVLIERPQHLSVAVFDVQGKEVVRLFDGFVGSPGSLDLIFDGERVASGVYFVRATGASGTRTRAITLQK